MTIRLALVVLLLSTNAGCAGLSFTPLNYQPKPAERALSLDEIRTEIARLAPTITVLHAHSGTIISAPGKLALRADHLLAHVSYEGPGSTPCDYMLALPLAPTAYEASENGTHTLVNLAIKPNNYRVLEDCASDAFHQESFVLQLPKPQALRTLDLIALRHASPKLQPQQPTTR